MIELTYKKFLIVFYGILTLFLFETKTCIYAKDYLLSNYIQTQYNDNTGLPTSSTNDIIQTKDGYIWIATYSGLVRYDSKNFKTIEDLPVSNIICLFEDSKNRFWIGTNENGLFLYENGKYTEYNTSHGICSNSIRTIIEDQNGNLIIGTAHGINKIDTSGNISIIDTSKLENNFIISLSCDTQNRLWGIDNLGNAFCLDNSNLDFYIKRRSVTNYNFTSVFTDSSGLVRIGTAGNQILEVIELTEEKLDFRSRAIENMQTVNSMYEDSDGNIWVCTDSGLGYFDTNNRFYQAKNTLIPNSFTKIFEDYEHNLWATSSVQGVLQLAPSKIKNLGYNLGITNEMVTSVIEYNNNIYIGTDSGLIISNKNYDLIENQLSKQLKDTRITHLFVSSDGTLWIGTKDLGLIRYQNRIITTFDTSNSALITNMVCNITEDNNNRIIIATNNGINIMEKGIITHSYTAKNGLDNSSILCIYQASDALYAGSDGNGLYIIKNDEITNLTEKYDLTSNSIVHISQSPKTGNIWISMTNSLGYIHNDKFHNIKNFNSISGTIFDIIYTETYLWLVCSNGIIRISEDSLTNNNFKNRCLIFNKYDGLTSSISSTCYSYLDEDFNLYIPCSSGINMLNLKDYKINDIEPKTVINSITIDGIEYPPSNELTIPADSKRISIDFSVLSFRCPYKNTVQYQLKGFDENIFNDNNLNIENISYTNLAKGTYTFHVRGTNGDDLSSLNDTVITIIRPPAFFERFSVRLILSLIFIIFAYICIKLYFKHKTKLLVTQKQNYKDIIAQSMTVIANAIDAKDSYTHGHSRRVALYSVKLAEKLGWSGDELDNLYYIALLHDIGKIGIPDNILNKPDRLTNDEYNYIKQHTLIGGEILKEITLIDGIADGARYHHERYDGKGYNSGLAGEKIPLIARIICVADTYDAMNSNRAYRKALSKDYILGELKSCSGKQFDPLIADIMIKLIKSGEIDDIEKGFRNI